MGCILWENNTFYLWSYVLKNAPQDLVVPSQFASVKAVYSSWQTGPYQTQVRQVNIQQLALIGYFSDGKMVRFTIPLQNIDVIHEDWVEIFRESSGQTVISETVVLKREAISYMANSICRQIRPITQYFS